MGGVGEVKVVNRLALHDAFRLRPVQSVLNSQDLDGGKCAEDVAVVSWVCAKRACSSASTKSPWMSCMLHRLQHSACYLHCRSMGYSMNVPASSSQQLNTYSTIASRSNASRCPMIHNAVNPQ
jgi:hypothetical protein